MTRWRDSIGDGKDRGRIVRLLENFEREGATIELPASARGGYGNVRPPGAARLKGRLCAVNVSTGRVEFTTGSWDRLADKAGFDHLLGGNKAARSVATEGDAEAILLAFRHEIGHGRVVEQPPAPDRPATAIGVLDLAVTDPESAKAPVLTVAHPDRDGQPAPTAQDPSSDKVERNQLNRPARGKAAYTDLGDAHVATRSVLGEAQGDRPGKVAPSGALDSYRTTWNQIVRDLLDGGRAVPEELQSWFHGYRGAGRGIVDLNAFPEPWIGDLDAPTCQGVMLGLNPGPSDHHYQGRDGVFAHEIRDRSFSDWAATWPYLKEPWQARNGKNRYHRSRLRFLRQWTDAPELPSAAMVAFEMYPWHSDKLTAALVPDPGLVREWVLQPVRALAAPVFAFGAPWLRLLPLLGLQEVDRLGAGGRPYGSQTASRTVVVYDLDGVPLIAEKHNGGAGPPSPNETALLKATPGN